MHSRADVAEVPHQLIIQFKYCIGLLVSPGRTKYLTLPALDFLANQQDNPRQYLKRYLCWNDYCYLCLLYFPAKGGFQISLQFNNKYVL